MIIIKIILISIRNLIIKKLFLKKIYINQFKINKKDKQSIIKINFTHLIITFKTVLKVLS